jgi:hypothetical protein
MRCAPTASDHEPQMLGRTSLPPRPHVFVSDKKPHDPNGECVNAFGGY